MLLFDILVVLHLWVRERGNEALFGDLHSDLQDLWFITVPGGAFFPPVFLSKVANWQTLNVNNGAGQLSIIYFEYRRWLLSRRSFDL